MKTRPKNDRFCSLVTLLWIGKSTGNISDSTHPASVEGWGLMGDRAVQSMVNKTVVRVPILVGQLLFNGSLPV
jgi:hypothetical protein